MTLLARVRQWRRRVFVEGGGSTARNAVAAGATSIPVVDAGWYLGTGGIVVSGPQRITYTGKGAAGGPSAPSGTASLVAGTLLGGPYTYKTTQIDAGVESPLSVASGSISIGAVPDPTSAITAANGSFAAPGSAPTAGTPTAGPGPDDGNHVYAVTFVTASGETTPGPSTGTVTTSTIAAPSTYPQVFSLTSGGSVDVGSHQWSATFVTAAGETTQSGTLGYFDATPGQQTVNLYTIPTGPSGTIARRLYRSKVSTSTPRFLLATINDNTTTTYSDTTADASLGAAAPSTNTATIQTVALTAIPTGPSGTTARKVYRTAAGGSQLKLLTTIANNTGTTFTDTTADSALGVNAPTSNTAGGALGTGVYGWRVTYTTATGETLGTTAATASISTGSAALSAIPVSADARVTGRKVYRTTVGGSTYLYEGAIADNTTTTYTSAGADGALGSTIPSTNTTAGGKISVTGIATGGGGVTARKLYRTISGGSTYKLVTTINDNTTTTYTDNVADGSLGVVAPGDMVTELTGIPASGPGSILYDIRAGDQVNLLVQCDDVAAQTALAAVEGGDGIHEHVIQDGRLGVTEATAVGNADLALFSRPIVTIRYATHDPKTRSGKTVHVNLPSLGLVGDFLIQSVTIDQIGIAPNTYPRYTVEASSVRFSFESVLRMLALKAGQ